MKKLRMLKNYNGTKFYNGHQLLKAGASWNVIISARADGKSFWIVKQALIDFLEEGKKFGYIRRYSDDVKNKYVTNYFSDPNMIAWLQSVSDYKDIICDRGEIWLMVDGEKGKLAKGTCCGYAFALNVAQRYKSQHFPDVYNIIFEEFMSDTGTYLYDEWSTFNHMISTITRRHDFRAFLIGNSIARDCPYLQELGIDLFKLQNGRIYTFDYHQSDGGIVKGAFDYVGAIEKESLFFGKAEKSIVQGQWSVQEQPHIFFNLRDAEQVYECIYLTSLHQAFKLRVVIFDDQKYIFVHPFDADEVPFAFCDVFTDFPYHKEGWFCTAEKKRHQKMLPLIRQRRVLFSDNLTGTEFSSAIKNYNPFRAA